ncbi:hypothetical protein NDU88_003363 [Pleurodeles waltl]|uniref:Uncharacterized protein n=1 Tax=Pleurodeles waltl TaxID=8319 RepID=A0AAV7M3S9_PLEWA|nr:hypothetical protein NDU88_003363 [Pleurodeles waltl]
MKSKAGRERGEEEERAQRKSRTRSKWAAEGEQRAEEDGYQKEEQKAMGNGQQRCGERMEERAEDKRQKFREREISFLDQQIQKDFRSEASSDKTDWNSPPIYRRTIFFTITLVSINGRWYVKPHLALGRRSHARISSPSTNNYRVLAVSSLTPYPSSP